jgi:hypothetical protein
MKTINDYILFADKVVFNKTGQHLDDIQIGVIEGVLERRRYADIAKKLSCTEGYVKDVGYQLWKLLSEIFGEEVNKSNIKSSLLRHNFTNNVSISGNDNSIGSIGQVNLCSELELSECLDKNGENEKFLQIIIRRLLKFGLSHQQIAECLGVNLEEIGLNQESEQQDINQNASL